ncbi:MAG: nucleoside monophosphate kinase [Puniceicoccales bacterium]|jgi:adenylate kinase|nr:nucleoside monophosphate kinase [Puniceicoccales bacterium]
MPVRNLCLFLCLGVVCLHVQLLAGDFNRNGNIRRGIPCVELGNSMKDEDKERAQEIFDGVLKTLPRKGKARKVKFPSKMVWLSGAPGSGKGTNVSSIMRALEISNKPIEVSALLNSPEDQEIKASGNLVDDERVVSRVFKALTCSKYSKGVIVDGFPRTRVQAKCLKLLADKIRIEGGNEPSSFIVVNFTVSRKTSVERQLRRGQEALSYNESVASSSGSKVPVRETDMSEVSAAFRYQTYVDKMRDCLGELRSMPEYYEIDTEGDMDTVRNRIHEVLLR